MGTPAPDNSGLLFPPNGSGKAYISLYLHRGNGNRKHKNKWAPGCGPERERELFCLADAGNWRGDNGHYWAVDGNQAAEIGDQGERIAKFPNNNNPNDPWHGYPVDPRDGRDNDCPPDTLVIAWIDNGTVTETVGFRIMRRRL